jgi:hypothetical protein
MEPTAATRLKALGWTAITEGLRSVAANWSRLCVEQSPVKNKTLDALQIEYRDLLEAMPVSDGDEIAIALRQFTRALRLKGDNASATQTHYLAEHSGLRHITAGRRYAFEPKSIDGTYEYLKPIINQEDSRIRTISTGALFYIAAHRGLGTLFPTFTDAFRDHWPDAAWQPGLVDASGRLQLEPLVQAHGCWIARLLNQAKGEPLVLAAADSPDYGDYDEALTTGSWLDDVILEEPEEDDSEWSAASSIRRHRERHPG